MEKEGNSKSNLNQEMRQILSEFLAGVIKLEQLVEVGKGFLVAFQQALEFLRRPSINETSELVQSILKQHETKRVKSYVEAGCVNASESASSVSQMSTSLSGLYDHLSKVQSILAELETLMDKAGVALQAEREDVSDMSELECVEVSDEMADESLDASDCASFMAVIFSMVKKDCLMQERLVKSLGLKSSSGELESYSLMWSLRPFVDEDVIHEAILCVK